ncbi:MAG TPA: RNA polymerase sigma-70 factor, partial [Puia sp.]
MTRVQKKAIDSQLVASCRGGDEKAFKELFHQYFQPLYFYALKYLPDRSSAEEIVMDVLLSIWQKRHLLKEELSFSSYLYRSVRNRVTDHFRRRHDRVVALDGTCHEPASAWIADGRVLYKELEHIYRSGINMLPPKKQLIFTMSREEGNSYQQIADKLRISKNTVENHMVAAIRQLRQHVGAKVCGLLLVLGLLSGVVRAQGDGFAYLKEHFAAPGQHFGSAPLWVWNTKVTKTDIDSALNGFKKNAFGGVFVHPRPGLITEYLSKEWFDDYAYTVKKAKELGLDVWIYDENSYPSGFAGGHVPDEMPESYNQGEMLHLTKTSTPPQEAGKYVYVLKEENGTFTDITSRLKEYAGKEGSYYLFNKDYYGRSPWYGGFSYVDLMVKGVTQKFIDVTMKGYEQSIGSQFGKTVRGIFSDEANIETQGAGNVRWTPDLFSSFRKKWGYDLLPNLPLLYEEKGEWRKVRHNYFQTLLDLFVDRWSKPYAAYAASKDLEWTGHYWEHDWPSPNNGPDNMAMYVYPQRPGIDMLFNQFNEESPNAQFGNIRSVKELASVSNQMGKKRNLSETYGGGGWDLTFKDMKRLGDWEFVLGVNTLNQHLSHMTLAGARKYDYPQSFSYHTPWWPYYGSLNKHFTRLTFALTRGEERNNILVLEPTTSAWMYYSTAGADPRFGEIAKEFQAFVTQLQKLQVEYDLGSEYVIRGFGSVAGGKFVVGKRSYGIVVIPPGMENVDKRTLALLKEFAGQGGRIVNCGELQYVDGEADKGVEGSFGKGREEEIRQGEDIAIEVKGGDLYHQRRHLKDGQLLFLANSDMQATAHARVRIAGKKVLLLNTFTGKIEEYPTRREGANVSFETDLPAAGSLLYFIGGDGIGNYPMMKMSKEVAVALGKTSVVRPRVNTLMIDFCDVHIGDTLIKDEHVYYAADTVFKHFGFKDGNPWNTSVQFRRNIVDRDTISRGRGFSVTYLFNLDGDVPGLEAVVERAGAYTISINGKVVKPLPGRWWLDKHFRILAIGSYVRAG